MNAELVETIVVDKQEMSRYSIWTINYCHMFMHYMKNCVIWLEMVTIVMFKVIDVMK